MRARAFSAIVIVLVIAVAGNSLAHAESASVLLEKGIYAEETKGDLDEAIKVYKRITADAQANCTRIACFQPQTRYTCQWSWMAGRQGQGRTAEPQREALKMERAITIGGCPEWH